MSIRNDIRFRVYITFSFIFLFGVAVIVRAAYIQVKDGKKLRARAEGMHTRFDTVVAERGNIYTEKGVLLSSSIPEFDVHIDFGVIGDSLFIKNIDSLCLCLADLFQDKSAAEYKEEFVNAWDDPDKNHYYLLGRKLKYSQYEALRSFPIFNKGKGSGGFIAEPRDKRETPYKMLAYRTLGVYRSDTNVSGIEKMYNAELMGENGRRVMQKSAGNIWVPVEGSEVDPREGKDVVTTLDMDVQDAAEHALMNILQRYECQYGTCIVMEVATGKIRSLVNLGRQSDGSYWEDFNYALMPTEPGSTFKLATLLSLLNDNMIQVDNLVDAQGGAIKFGGRTMKDSHMGLGVMPIWKAFAESSNAALAWLANTYYKDNPSRFVNNLRGMGLASKTGIDLPGERGSVIVAPGKIGDNKPSTWSNTSLPWLGIGYGVQITPMHTCMLYNAIANNGQMMKPYLVSAIREYGKDVKTIEPVALRTVAPPKVVAQLQKCLRAVVTEGTAKGIQSPYYTMAGKTGTALVADKNITYNMGVYQGSFVGYLPADNPKYTICVAIRTQAHSKAYYGGLIAAPVFRMVADKIFSENMGAWAGPLDSLAKHGSGGSIPSRTANAKGVNVLLAAMGKHAPVPVNGINSYLYINSDSTHRTAVYHKKIDRTSVPDVTGMGLKDAVFILENNGLRVTVLGHGRVSQQSVAPGTPIYKGLNIVLQLS